MTSICYPFTSKFKITSLFGTRRTGIGGASTDHLGVDLVAQGDETVVAVCSGRVTKIDNTGNSKRGLFVWISGEDGFGTLYQHLSQIYVKTGQSVITGQAIGKEGNSGKGFTDSNGNPISLKKHLHFGVSRNSSYTETMKNRKANAINPLEYLNVDSPYTAKGKIIDGSQRITFASYYTIEGLLEGNDAPTVYIKDLKGTTRDILYGRRYRVFISLGDGQSLDVSSLRCKFEIVKSYFNCDNRCILSIYNLNVEDEAKIIKNAQKIYIEAGYSGSTYGKIYEGHIFQVFRGKEKGTDYILSIVAFDSPSYSLYNVTNTTLIAQASLRDAVNTITKNINQGQITDKISEIKYPRGKILFGGSNVLLEQIKKSESLAYYIDDGQVNLINVDDAYPGEIIELSPESGLIDAPSQIQEGITCTCLLNPHLKLNGLFHIDNSKVQGMQMELGQYQVPLDSEGIYRIIKMVYRGDTRGDNWQIDITALTQSGKLPNMAEDIGTSIF